MFWGGKNSEAFHFLWMELSVTSSWEASSWTLNSVVSACQRRLGDAAKRAIGKLTTRTVKKGDKVNSFNCFLPLLVVPKFTLTQNIRT